jgi:hypothetical protein
MFMDLRKFLFGARDPMFVSTIAVSSDNAAAANRRSMQISVRTLLLMAAVLGIAKGSPAVAQVNTPSDQAQILSLPTWKTVSLGTFVGALGLMTALDEANIAVGDLADEAMHRPAFAVSRSKSDVDVVVLSTAQLGVGMNGGTLQDILTRARRLGFDLCPPEVAAQLRLLYLDQPVGEFLDIAMAPITIYGGHPVGFSLANGGAGLMLVGYIMKLDATVEQRRKFVFARPLRIAQPVDR